VKPQFMEQAKHLFKDTEVKIANSAQRDLGAIIGNKEAVHEELQLKVQKWVDQVEVLAQIAATQPHAAHSAFTLGLRHRWTYLQRTMAPLHNFLQPLEDAIRNRFIPALLGETSNYAISDLQRDLYALPARLGGLSIDNPVIQAKHKYQESLELSQSLKDLIKSPAMTATTREDQHSNQNKDDEAALPDGNQLDKSDDAAISKVQGLNPQAKRILKIWEEQKELQATIKSKRKDRQKEEADRIYGQLDEIQKRSMKLAQKKGASAIYSRIPLEKYGFNFARKRDFRDLLRMRYKLHIPNLPVTCACGKSYSLDHSQKCLKGGFIALRHDEPKILFGRLASHVFKDVEIEPHLDSLSGEKFKLKSANRNQDARSDVRIRGFWGNKKDAFFEFRVFYPFASSLANKSVDASFSRMSKARKREYEERITQVDNASFTPMILASTGGTGDEMDVALKVLGAKLAEKNNEVYSHVMGDIRARFAFAIARSSLICLRGSRSIWSQRQSDLIKEHDNCSSRLLMSDITRY